MGTMASQITIRATVYSTVYSGADQRKHQSSASLAFVRVIRRSQMASNAENVSIWCRHHAVNKMNLIIWLESSLATKTVVLKMIFAEMWFIGEIL